MKVKIAVGILLINLRLSSEVIVDDGRLDDFVVFDEDEFLF